MRHGLYWRMHRGLFKLKRNVAVWGLGASPTLSHPRKPEITLNLEQLVPGVAQRVMGGLQLGSHMAGG